MTQYYSRTDIPYAGDSNFTIPFSYIDKTDIHVYINDTLISTWVWLNDSQINITSTLSAGDVVSIRRITPIDEKIVTYQNMSMVLNDDNLNLSQDQVLNAVQEVYDNNVSFQIDVNAQIDEIDTKVDTANATANQALSNSETAISIANEALSNSEDAVTTANAAETKADNAVSTANTALSNASQAVSTANEANTNAQAAVSTAESAVSTANSASNEAAEAIEKAELAILTANDASDDALDAVSKAEEAIEIAQTAVSQGLTPATTTSLGGIKVGANLSITTDGTLSADAQSIEVDDELSTTSENPVQNKVITNVLNKKQTTIEAGENIRITQPADIRVPEGYTQLERINSSSGACCIDTGLTGAIKWEIDVMGNSPYPTKRALIATDGNGSAFFGQYSGSSAWGTNGNSTGVSIADRINLVINFTTTGCNGTINGTSFSYSATGNLSTNWVLFGTSNYGTRLYGYLYSAKATQNGLVVFDGVPAVRDSDHVSGLYDVVSGNFFTSATTTEFSAGSILSTNTVVSADVGNGTLTISRYGTTLATFTANQTGNTTANMTNPAIQPKEIGASSILNSSTTKAVNSLLYCGNDNLVHSYTETNVPISMAYGMFVNSSQLTANSSISYYYRGEKLGWSVPSAMRIFTARHKVWARCTYPDSSGNVYFVSLYDQNGSVNTLQGGYTYYYLGCASSTSTIALDVTGSHFLSINTDGKLTHIDGVEIKQPEDSSSRNIGEIVTSTIPLTDVGLHLLDGSLIQGDGIYADFVNYIAGLDLTANYFCTETEWQQSITDYGVCGKFVYTQPTYQLIDTASGTTGWFVHSLEVGSQVYATNGTPQITIASVSGNHITVTGTQAALFPNGFDRDTANDVVASVRLPKITGIVEGTTDLTALGDLVEAGLPNITGNGKWIHETGTGTGAFYSETGNLNQQASGSGGEAYNKVYFDASRSSSIYGNSNTVQPQTIKVLYYIVIATSTKTDIQVDIDEIATDLNGKADVDLSNLTTTSSPNLDGQWVESFSLIANEVTIPTNTNDDYSLSSYLPNDNYNYEVMLEGSATTASTSGSLCNLRVTTDVITANPVYICGIRTRTASTMSNMSSVIVPVGIGRSVSVNALSSMTGNYILAALAYRRIGTNT